MALTTGLDLTNLTASCQAALPSLLTSNFATCADFIGLAQLATPSGSLVDSLNGYLGDLCTTTPCNQTDLTTTAGSLNSSCSADVQSGSLIPIVLVDLIANFNDIRNLLCTKNTNTSDYCLIETLSTAQNATGVQLTLSTLTEVVSSPNGTAALLSRIPSSVYCTDCGHALVTEIIPIAAKIDNSTANAVREVAVQQCGANFGDGQIPPTVSVPNATTTNSSA